VTHFWIQIPAELEDIFRGELDPVSHLQWDLKSNGYDVVVVVVKKQDYGVKD
jgi:hypothetical protein